MSDPIREFVERISKQTPEKPDYWSSCGQCERNASEAEDLLEAPTTPTVDAAVAQEPVGTLTVSTFRGHLENTDFDYSGKLPNGTYSLYTAAQPAAGQSYDTAFYEIASVLGITARPGAPADIFKNEMLPRLKNLVAAVSLQPAASVGVSDVQGLAAFLRAEATGVNGPSANTLRNWAKAVDRVAAAGVGVIAIQEAWEAAGGNPGIKATREELLTALRQLDEVCDDAASVGVGREARTKLAAVTQALKDGDCLGASLALAEVEKLIDAAIATHSTE